MHILIAPNAFKNSATATAATEAIQQGLQSSKLSCTTECFPIADGGDGTAELIVNKCNGVWVDAVVSDPLGRPITSAFGLIDDGKTAVIEMANASGLRLLKADELVPMHTSSYGTGQLMKIALDRGVNKIILAMGGSATVDGGCGILNALGINFLDAEGNTLTANPEGLQQMAAIDTSGLDSRIANCEIVVVCDVDNKLLGDNGAAAVFGPQKGATAEQVKLLDGFLANFSAVTLEHTGKNIAEIKYGGAAGGATAGVHAYLNARLVNGIEYFLQLTGFDKALQNADVVITGEGSIDTQTLQGKGPFGVAAMAKQYGLPVIGIAGMVPLNGDPDLRKYFDVLLAIGNGPADMPNAIKNTHANLVRMGTEIGTMLAIPRK
ncbi:glycerate kinase [Mucilaginibacter calamicampi]|uniref:Glycerate kinase n=1 Tax=Mucilaginibacter calamicampi TaxID=1302352 RepID=A0ABW2YUS7_9SPHI